MFTFRASIALFLVCLFCLGRIEAQVDSLNHDPEPKEGVTGLALHYFKIDFTKAQRNILQDSEVEIIFMVDAQGNGQFEKANGISDGFIIDSLRRITPRVAKFSPQIVDGKPVPSIYFLSLQFPRYGPMTRSYQFDGRFFKKPTIDDFEYYQRGNRWDMLIGGLMNQFAGTPSEYLGTGGGMKVDLLYAGPRNIGAGLIMSFYGNTSKKDYPIATPRPQEKAPPTLIVGLGVNHRKTFSERREMSLQLELGYAIQNVMAKNAGSDDLVQLRGFSPGLILNYQFMLGKESLSTYYFDPVITSNHLNLHVGMRYLSLNLDQATGFMFELGLSYKLRFTFIKEYQFKGGF